MTVADKIQIRHDCQNHCHHQREYHCGTDRLLWKKTAAPLSRWCHVTCIALQSSKQFSLWRSSKLEQRRCRPRERRPQTVPDVRGSDTGKVCGSFVWIDPDTHTRLKWLWAADEHCYITSNNLSLHIVQFGSVNSDFAWLCSTSASA